MAYKFNYNDFSNHKVYDSVRPLAHLVLGIKFRIKYVGEENLPREGGYIIAANHISAFDPITIAAGSRVRMHFMAKQELFENPLLGRFLKSLNSFPVDRAKFDNESVGYAVNLINDGKVLGIFPEGTRSPDYKPQKGKAGICYIAKKCKCDVVPVSLYTEDEAKTGTRLTVRYGKPVRYEELGFNEDTDKLKDLRKANELIMQRITELWEEGHED